MRLEFSGIPSYKRSAFFMQAPEKCGPVIFKRAVTLLTATLRLAPENMMVGSNTTR
jgi:hypothetical protein